MFEEMTFDNIMKDMLGQVGSGFDKREGSIIYDALAPAALELAQLYADLDAVLNQVFADTAAREYLVRRAAERGISPYEASCSEVKGVFNIEVGIGSRFSLGEVNFIALEYFGVSDDGYYIYSMGCETAGTVGNVVGSLIPIENISGLTYAEAVEILVYGDDEEDTEKFRERYFESINNIAFGGNVADYKAKVGAMDGVGGVKVLRADDWLGAGTVKVIITTSENTSPSAELVSMVKETLDPSDREGEGVGLSPIGHIVTVEGAESSVVSVSVTIKTDGTNGNLEEEIKAAVQEYIDEVNTEWEDVDNAVIYLSRITGKLINVSGIYDVSKVYINGAAANYTLNTNCIAVLGAVVVKEA